MFAVEILFKKVIYTVSLHTVHYISDVESIHLYAFHPVHHALNQNLKHFLPVTVFLLMNSPSHTHTLWILVTLCISKGSWALAALPELLCADHCVSMQ